MPVKNFEKFFENNDNKDIDKKELKDLLKKLFESKFELTLIKDSIEGSFIDIRYKSSTLIFDNDKISSTRYGDFIDDYLEPMKNEMEKINNFVEETVQNKLDIDCHLSILKDDKNEFHYGFLIDLGEPDSNIQIDMLRSIVGIEKYKL